MIYYILLLLNSHIYNDFYASADFYRLPDYYNKNYREIIKLDIDNVFNLENDYFYFSSYLKINELINFDSFEENSYGIKKHLIQAKEFKLALNWNFLDFSIGRLLYFEDNFMESIDGINLNFNYKFLELKYLYGSVVTEDDFLGKVHFFDFKDFEDFKEKDYDVHFISLNFYNKDSFLKFTFLNYLLQDNSSYKMLSLFLNLNYKDLSLYGYFKRELIQEENNIKIQLSYKYIALLYEEFIPIFFKDSIFSIFSKEKYKRFSILGEYENFKIELFEEYLFDNYGARFSYFYRNINFLLKYSNNNDFLLSSNFKSLININLTMYFKKYYYSLLSRFSYVKKLGKRSNLELYSTLIYSKFYKFQARVGFYLESSL